MPELPEVETVRRELESSILNKKIVQIKVLQKAIIKGSSKKFEQGIKNQKFTSIERIGKLLIFHLDNSSVLLAHLKMTGQFIFREEGEILAGIYPLLYASTPGGEKTAGHFREQQEQRASNDRHSHIVFRFEDNSELVFRDQRKFGYLKVIPGDELPNIRSRFGPDPLHNNFSAANFSAAFKGRKKSLKAVLMDQQLIAGIGNIYADEICHRVELRPQRSVRRISQAKLQELHQQTLEVIQEAVHNKGTTFRDFSRTDGKKGEHVFQLRVYKREGAPCLNCQQGIIKKIRHQGRGTHFCPNCQH